MYEARQHMAVLNAEVVMWTKHISGNHSCKATPMLLKVRPVEHTRSFTDRSHSCDGVNL